MDSNFIRFLGISNTVGFISSLICLSLFLFLAFKNKKYVDRITLRLQAALSVVDLALHSLVFCYGIIHTDTTCKLFGFVAGLLNSTYLTIVSVITLNLHMNILCVNKFHKKYVKFFWVLIIFIPFLINVPLYFYGMFGKDSFGMCLVSATVPHRKLLVIFAVMLPVFAVFIYCITVITLIFIKTKKDDELLNRMLNAHNVNDQESKLFLRKLLNNWILRIVLYPVAFCLIQSGFLVDFTLQTIFNKLSIFAIYWDTAGTCLSGLINLIAFLCDPYFQSAIRNIFKKPTELTAPYEDNLKEPTELQYNQDGSHAYSRESSSQNGTLSGHHYQTNPSETDRLLRNVTRDF